MHRVELKAQLGSRVLVFSSRVPNVPCGVVLGYNSFYEVFMGEFIVGVGFGSSFWV